MQIPSTSSANQYMDQARKPRLLFFQRIYARELPEFIRTQAAEHVKCLAENFDVTVINRDCDYPEMCDIYQPDLAMFETGVNLASCRRLQISRTRADAMIPKIGFVNADAWCETRSGTISEMEHWGLECLFSISSTALEHTPELADRLFIWPVFVDTDVFRNYHLPKLIPVLLTGSTAPQYPWRHRVYEHVARRYPCLVCPHHGYLAQSRAGEMMYGEQYAQAINASLVVPACGTVAKEIVRKHFEIPACNACLVAERSAALEAAGFVDMENCVFAGENDVLAKLSYLFNHGHDLQRITTAGHDLVQARHTLKHRDQVAQWFGLRGSVRGGQRLIQSGPFGAFKIVSADSRLHNGYVCGGGLHLRFLAEGDASMARRDYDEAEAAYRHCLAYMNALPEARLKLAICLLYQGNATAASQLLFNLLEYTLAEYRAPDPDPVEWAYHILALLCRGDLSLAGERARQFPALRHPELDRTRHVVDVLSGMRPTTTAAGNAERKSIHRLPVRSMHDWTQQVCRMLKACNQHAIALRLTDRCPREAEWQPFETVSSDHRRTSDRGAVQNSGSPTPEGLGSFGACVTGYKLGRRMRRSYRRLAATVLKAVGNTP
jgi:Glycosyl transferases group 1/Tetratricopeptide repeat